MNRDIFKDQKLPAVIIIVIALIGLGWIQYRILQKYYHVSREKYDQQVAVTLSRMAEETYNRAPLSNLISAIITGDTVSFPVGMDSLRSAGTHFYRMYITDRFKRANLSTSFEFAVRDRITDSTYLASNGYTGGVQWLGNYKLPLEGIISNDCGCAPYLNIRYNRLDSILFQSLQIIIYPAIGFFLLLLTGFYLLIRILREQKYLDRVKNDFINNLTHEIKTPVFAISLATRLMREKPGYDLSQYLDQVEGQVAHLKMNVEKVLELASIENSQQLLQFTQVPVDEVIMQTVEEYSRDKTINRISMDLHAESTEVNADPVHLKNALSNLLDNALKYSNEKMPVEISTTIEGDFVKITVRDYGEGIEKEHQDAIFEKFYRVHHNGHKVTGFGLGLSYVRQVIGLMHGSVSLTSMPREGSQFQINLPLSK